VDKRDKRGKGRKEGRKAERKEKLVKKGDRKARRKRGTVKEKSECILNGVIYVYIKFSSPQKNA
jgi:hypothetical protein